MSVIQILYSRSTETNVASGVNLNFNLDSVRPTRKSFDYKNKFKHHNRILLEAEPQIGKTGVYLSVS